MSTLETFSWTLMDLQHSVDGECLGVIDSDNSVMFTSISTDSRSLQPGALYIAIKGENFDGHQFIPQAIQQGAVAVLVSEEVDSVVPGVLVDDTRLALGLFAKWHRQQMPVKKLIAVTGSNGKTTTKSLLLNIFQNIGHTLATEGNLNNDFGVPRTLLNLRPEHEYAIIEMGANHRGEIAYLTKLALPDIALITNASDAHLEGFGSLQGVIETKGGIFQGLNRIGSDRAGVAVMNTDSNGYLDWLKMTEELDVHRVVRFGLQSDAEVAISDLSATELGIQFTLTFNGLKHPVEMPVLGEHNAFNAAACVAVALNAGLTWSQILPGLTSFTGVAGRLQKQKIATGWLIDDSYNANPASVKAGIDALVSLPGLSILCLGAMAELGGESVVAHQEIAKYAKQRRVDYLFVFGEATLPMIEQFGNQSNYFDSHEALAQAVSEILGEQRKMHLNANVLIKGSRSAQMEEVSNHLL